MKNWWDVFYSILLLLVRRLVGRMNRFCDSLVGTTYKRHPGPYKNLEATLNPRDGCPEVVPWPISFKRVIPTHQINYHFLWVCFETVFEKCLGPFRQSSGQWSMTALFAKLFWKTPFCTCLEANVLKTSENVSKSRKSEQRIQILTGRATTNTQ